MTQIKFDEARKAIFAEWPEGEEFGESRLLTWPIKTEPTTAGTISAETLQADRFYQVGYSDPYDAGDVGGDIQDGIAWQRRWATWHNSGDGLYWRVAQVTAYAAEDEARRFCVVTWEFVQSRTLHGVYDEQDEDGYSKDRDLGDIEITDASVRDYVEGIPDAEATERALDWFEAHP